MDSQCSECVGIQKAIQRKMTKLSKLAKVVNVTRLVDLTHSNVYTSIVETNVSSTVNLNKLLYQLVEETLLNSEEKDIA